MIRHKRRFWPFVAWLAMAQMVGWGSLYFAFTLFVAPVCGDLGWDRTSVASTLSLALGAWACAALPVGLWLDRSGGRIPMALGSLAAGLLLGACSSVQRYESFLGLWLGLGIAMAMVLSQPAYATVRRIFDQASASSAVIALNLATGLAATIFIPGTQALITHFGWRHALQFLACLNLGCAAIYALLVPADPISRQRMMAPCDAARMARTHRGSLRCTIMDPRFRAIVTASVGKAAISTSLAVYLLPMPTEQGFSHPAAISVLALAGPVTVAARIAMFASGSRWVGRGRTLGVIAVSAQLLAQITLAVARPSLGVSLVIFTVLNGISEGAFTIALPLVTPEIWGPTNYATIQGAIQAVSMLGRAGFPALIAVLWSISGNYGFTRISLVVVALISAVAYVFAVSPRRIPADAL
jgi:MFS family permease